MLLRKRRCPKPYRNARKTRPLRQQKALLSIVDIPKPPDYDKTSALIHRNRPKNTLFTIEIKRLTYRNHPRKHTLRQRPPFRASRITKRPPIHLNSSPPHSHNKPRSSTPGSVLRGVLIWLLWEIALTALLLCFCRSALNCITPYPVC